MVVKCVIRYMFVRTDDGLCHGKIAGVMCNVIQTGACGPSVRMSLMDLPHRPKGP